MTLIRWFLTKNSRIFSIIARSILTKPEIEVLKTKQNAKKDLLLTLDRQNTTTRKKYFLTLEATINIKMHLICKLLMNKWHLVRKEKEDRVSSIHLNSLKINSEPINFNFYCPKVTKSSKIFFQSVKIGFWIICLMSLQSWCFTVSILIDLEMS